MSTAVASIRQDANLNVVSPSSNALVFDAANMDSMMRLAEVMATGKITIPRAFANSPGDCLAVVMQAMQWKMNPFAVAQKTFIVNGTLGYEAQLVHAAVSASGILTSDDFDFEFYGPWEKVVGKFDIRKGDKGEYRVPGWHLSDEIGCGVIVRATLRATGQVKELDLLLAQARTRNSTLWADDPKQQLGYLAVKKWARRYAPGVILGVYTPDELEPPPQERDMGVADVVPPSHPQPVFCSDEKFQANKEKWKELITSGQKSVENLIIFLDSKATLTDTQRSEIKGWTVKKEEQADQDHSDFLAGLDDQ